MLALAALPAAADEFTYTLSTDHCTGGCGTAPFGSVDVKAIGGGTNGAGEVQVTVTLTGTDKFVSTGFAGSFGFNLVSPFNGTVTLSNFSSGFGVAGTQSAGSGSFDGFGQFEYAVQCTSCGSGGSNPNGGPLVFDVTEAGLLASDFAQLSSLPPGNDQAYFVADILGSTGHTGPVGAMSPGTPVGGSVPEPGSVMLFGSAVSFLAFKLKTRISQQA
jgi:hypothetical protein